MCIQMFKVLVTSYELNLSSFDCLCKPHLLTEVIITSLHLNKGGLHGVALLDYSLQGLARIVLYERSLLVYSYVQHYTD